ncbi:MAG: hypothetical protein ABIP68_06560 [Ferruginibacter sp.]
MAIKKIKRIIVETMYKMEEDITQSLKQAEALKQSILKKAFELSLI